MQAIDKLNHWTNTHDRGYLVDIVRVLFGVFLIYKGVEFARDPVLASSLLWPESDFAAPVVVGHIVVMTHLCGGLFLVFGFLTRIVALLLLPVLATGSVALLLNEAEASRVAAALAGLGLCLVFLVIGSGKGSADRGLHMHM